MKRFPLFACLILAGLLASCETRHPTPPANAPDLTSAQSTAQSPQTSNEEVRPSVPVEPAMSTEQLISLIRAGYDDRALEAAPQSPPGSFERVEPLVADLSPEVRATALRVLYALDAPRAQPLVIKALGDPSDDVKIYAVALLRPSPPSGIMGHLLGAYQNAREPALRGQIALLAGRVTPVENIDAWRLLHQAESDPYAKDDLTKALARMGDEPSRVQYVASMNAATGRKAFDLVRGATYFEDPWIIPHLMPLLDRRDVVIHLAPDYKNTHPFRICDVALESLLALTGEKVDFKTPRPTQYSDTEIAKVRSLATKKRP